MNKLTSGIAGLVLALSATTAANALTTITFDTLVTGGEVSSTFAPSTTFNGLTGSGSVTYDETLGTLFDTTIDPAFDFSLTMFGQTFSSGDDEFGSASYDATTGDLFFSVSEVALINPVAIALADVESFFFDSAITPLLGGGNQVNVYVIEGDGACTTNCTLTPVPLPATLPLVLAGMGLMGWVSSRRRNAA